MAWGSAMRRLGWIFMLLGMVLAAPACAADKGKELPPAPFVPASGPAGEDYTIGPLDALTVFVWVEQVVVAELLVREGLQHLAQTLRFEVLCKGCDQQGTGGQTLLAVNYQQSFLAGYRRQTALNVDDGANEVRLNLFVAPGIKIVAAQLVVAMAG